jgi:DNA-binding protein HU-beta
VGFVNKGDLITSVAKASGLTKLDAEKAINATFQSITATLKKGDYAFVMGFGRFTIAQRQETTGRNPRTGEKIQIPAKRVVKFTSAQPLKDAVNLEEVAAMTSKENVKAEKNGPKVVAKDDKASSAKAKKPKKS